LTHSLPHVVCIETPDPASIVAYERAFYDAFAPLDSPPLRRLWLWDDGMKRLSSGLPYETQLLFLGRDGRDRLEIAMAVNVGQGPWQATRFGFDPPRGEGVCEFVSFFSRRRYPVRCVLSFCRDVFADLRARGLTAGYATATDRMRRVYDRCGAELVASNMVDGHARHLLHFSTDRASIQARPKTLPI
jgi:hypothetical protein